jgi:hypothetical protein
MELTPKPAALIDALADALQAIYTAHGVGGNLHVVIDDGNLDDATMAWARGLYTLGLAEGTPEQIVAEGQALALLQLLPDEDARLYALHRAREAAERRHGPEPSGPGVTQMARGAVTRRDDTDGATVQVLVEGFYPDAEHITLTISMDAGPDGERVMASACYVEPGADGPVNSTNPATWWALKQLQRALDADNQAEAGTEPPPEEDATLTMEHLRRLGFTEHVDKPPRFTLKVPGFEPVASVELKPNAFRPGWSVSLHGRLGLIGEVHTRRQLAGLLGIINSPTR